MLRSVWMDDRPTFNIVFGWSLANLRTRNDNLFAWQWGPDPKLGSYGVLDKSAAADADQDIAVALILASRRWRDENYLRPAREIMTDIWENEVELIRHEPYLLAGDWARTWQEPVINPSYFAPYAYRLFDEVDKNRDHAWIRLIDTSYRVLEASARLSTTGLPPDWCVINRETGAIGPAKLRGETSGDYAYDAWGVMWRLTVDAQWFGESRALSFIKNCKFLVDYWHKYEHLSESIEPNGQIRSDNESISQLGIHLAMFALIDKRIARKIYEERLMASYDRLGKTGFWGNPRDYYSQNWAWLGIALYAGIVERY